MSYTKKIEERKNEYIDIFPSYSIHYSEEESGKLRNLNFSARSSNKEVFPDYTAKKIADSGEEEIWSVSDEENELEVPINSGYTSKDSLAYKLHNAYETLLED